MKHTLEILLAAMKEAGAAIWKMQNETLSISQKANQDIVTQADLVANAILKEHLLSAYPQDGWLSEESHDDLKRLMQERVWIVDPIDGTREYAKGEPEYAISVALVVNHQPQLASVFNPATQELFYAMRGEGAWLNDRRLFCSDKETKLHSLLASRSEYQRGEWDAFKTCCTIKPMGSIAYKMALVAANAAHATFSLGPKHEWDIVAGALIMSEAGGFVSNKHGQAFHFNQRQVLVDGVVACAHSLHTQLFSLIR